MKPACIIRPTAQAEIDDHAEYIALDNLKAAQRFLAAIQELFQDLVRMPGLGRAWESLSPRLVGVRIHPIPGFRNYLVFYRPIEDGIEVLHIFHGARDIENILENPEQ